MKMNNKEKTVLFQIILESVLRNNSSGALSKFHLSNRIYDVLGDYKEGSIPLNSDDIVNNIDIKETDLIRLNGICLSSKEDISNLINFLKALEVKMDQLSKK